MNIINTRNTQARSFTAGHQSRPILHPLRLLYVSSPQDAKTDFTPVVTSLGLLTPNIITMSGKGKGEKCTAACRNEPCQCGSKCQCGEGCTCAACKTCNCTSDGCKCGKECTGPDSCKCGSSCGCK